MHRRLLAVLAAMVCVFAVCVIASGRNGNTLAVYTAVQGIPPGTTLTEDQVRLTTIPAGLAPDGAVTTVAQIAGRMTAGPIPAGAILADADFVAATQAAAGYVIIPLTVSPELLTILNPGDHVSVFLTDFTTKAVEVARGLRVVTIPQPSGSGLFGSSTASFVLVEVPEAVASQISGASSGSSTTVAIE